MTGNRDTCPTLTIGTQKQTSIEEQDSIQAFSPSKVYEISTKKEMSTKAKDLIDKLNLNLKLSTASKEEQNIDVVPSESSR